ncbi:MAG: amino-acid N-acetyltransferase [Betaproteobacteria bacterium]|nr:amino-acid N-acetyltransferase [Betaproteobacteria bacterium]
MAVSTPDRFVQWFRAAAPYIHAFRGRTFVIAFGGEVVLENRFVGLNHDLNLLAALGVRLVVVHGARAQIDVKLNELGHKTRYVRGLRVTDDITLACAKEASGRLRVEIEALLSMGLPNSPMANADIRVSSGNFVTAKPIGILDGIDLQHTGEVRKVDVPAINDRLNYGELVLISPLGFSATGEIFNVALENVAESVAVALQAEKLIFMTDRSGVTSARGHLYRELTPLQARKLINRKDTVLDGDAQLYLPCAVRACEQGVKRAHLISRHAEGALLQELFTHHGVGTMIAPDPVEKMRDAKITDIGAILALIEPLEADGTLVKRGRDLLEMEINRFAVLDHDGMIIGCAALYPFAEERAAELACLVVHPDFRGRDAGERLLEAMEQRARRKRLKKIFVLTTRAEHWFVERGFAEVNVDELPAQKREMYNYQRRSVVLIKRL